MDTVSHALWGATIIRKQPEVWWAAFFGALPDLWIVIPLFTYLKKNKFRRFKNQEFWSEAESSSLCTKLYYYSHSFITASVLTLIIYLLLPSHWFIAIPYFLHILSDILSHREKWAAHIFYPLTNFHFNFLNWWQAKWITVLNWLFLILINVGFWFKK